MSITTKVPVPVDATLRVEFDHPAHPSRDATGADLANFGYVRSDELYLRLRDTIALVATGDAATDLTSSEWCDTAANQLRYLLEVAVHYATSPDAVLAHLSDGPEDTSVVDALRPLLTAPVD